MPVAKVEPSSWIIDFVYCLAAHLLEMHCLCCGPYGLGRKHSGGYSLASLLVGILSNTSVSQYTYLACGTYPMEPTRLKKDLQRFILQHKAWPSLATSHAWRMISSLVGSRIIQRSVAPFQNMIRNPFFTKLSRSPSHM